MDRRVFVVGVMVALVPASVSAQQAAPAAASTPVALVRGFYAKNFKEERMPLSASLRKLSQAALANSKKLNEPVSGYDFQWTTNSQELEPDLAKTLKVSALDTQANSARVEANFKSGDETRKITYLLIRDNNRWVVNDILYVGSEGEKSNLADLLREGAKP